MEGPGFESNIENAIAKSRDEEELSGKDKTGYRMSMVYEWFYNHKDVFSQICSHGYYNYKDEEDYTKQQAIN